QSFKWRNLAAKNAAVICVIVGLRKKSNDKKILFNDDIARTVDNIGPYLIDMDNICIDRLSKPLSSRPKMYKGNQPSDGGHLILTPEQKDKILGSHPSASKFLKKYYGSQDFLK